jgi:hypothetical protein
MKTESQVEQQFSKTEGCTTASNLSI